MDWKLKFISEENLKSHVEATIGKYGAKLEPFDIKSFNSNIIDPIKLIFDKTVYRYSWEDIVSKEIFRQRDKGNNNDIGYFHQGIFQYIPNCHVPQNGKEGGWDVIYTNPNGIVLPDKNIVHKIYVEMKNKHNTMNSASAGKTYIKMQHQLLSDDDCACFLVEAIAQRSQNIKWETTVDGKKVSHRNIRRVSIDQFYELVTGEKDSFYQLCMVLPETIEGVVKNSVNLKIQEDSVFEELKNIAKEVNGNTDDLAMAIAVYMLGFGSYSGFKNLMSDTFTENDSLLKRIYEYAKKLK
ncbi:MAG: Eco47II family restriction endonuclease [Paenibacillaceae bacterium]|nr:Eco47II family restriction endonuclease [Paenibacillaceae bacterium]